MYNSIRKNFNYITINIWHKILSNIKYLINFVLNKNRFFRLIIILLIDSIILYLSAIFSLRPYQNQNIINSPASFFIVIVGLILFIIMGYYKGITRYTGSQSLYKIATGNILIIFIIILTTNIIFKYSIISYTWLQLYINFTLGIVSVRVIIRDLYIAFRNKINKLKKKIYIYGAGSAGAQLAYSLRIEGKHIIKGFIDDSSILWGRTIGGITIYSPTKLRDSNNEVDQILLAIPSLNKHQRKILIKKLDNLVIPVLTIPSIDELISKKAKIDSIRPIEIEELLERKAVAAKNDLLGPNITNSVVCVTGAGGSIGGELCSQILKLKPNKLIILENSEPSLWKIYQHLNEINTNKIQIISVLGSTSDLGFLTNLFSKYQVNNIFHAAAYKHVPLVEANPIEGLKNNVLSTKSLCIAAKKCKVKNVLLISTDKAVRPTSIMGASKRLSELIFQAFADIENQLSNNDSKTIFSMVRFGNVLNSSGSVVPIFKKQIALGGPITLTHENIIRYFMTISEAAQLVIQSSVLAKGGDVFLLDMGEPVSIKNLAKKMIRLSGLKIKNTINPDGDIEIITTGLRPGEKLYEETLIDGKAETTIHPLIYRAKERFLPKEKLFKQIDQLELLLKNQSLEDSLNLLKTIVPEWKRESDYNK